MIDLDRVKSWLKVDDDEQDDDINDLIEEAVSELKLSGVPEFDKDSAAYPLYRKAIKYIITRDFESRGMEEFEDKTLKSMILKLKAMVVNDEIQA